MPSQSYQKIKIANGLNNDPVQDYVISLFEDRKSLLEKEAKRMRSNRFMRKNRRDDILGLYLWGGVGRGKTMLMDIFFDALNREDALRMHFHAFMSMVHDSLHEFREKRDPLVYVARKIARAHRVLCLDECHVNDIGDAMILGKLMHALFERRVMLITTSNRPPDDLYKDGLQRDRFIPAINAIKAQCQVVELDGEQDYRLIALQKSDVFYSPLNSETKQQIEDTFKTLTTNHIAEPGKVTINGRNIPHIGEAEGCIWFEFSDLCEGNRSNEDYQYIAAEHHSVFISNVPQMGTDHNDAARRFLNLLDVFYDQKVKLIMTMETHADSLYIGKKLAFEFERAISRLQEMQSAQYLHLPHLG